MTAYNPLKGVAAVERLRYLRLTGRQKALIWITLVFALLLGLTIAAVLHMKPIVVNLATARTSNTVNRIVVAAINDAVDSGRIDYGRLVDFDKDTEGRVTALKSNMAEFNRLQAAIADDILQRMAEVSTTDLSIPIGTLTGSPLLAGRGLQILQTAQHVVILVVGDGRLIQYIIAVAVGVEGVPQLLHFFTVIHSVTSYPLLMMYSSA